jgi:cell shape-determining protein MreD
MTIDVLKHIARFFLLVALQVLFLNNIQLSSYINPYVYIMFIMSLPFNTSRWLVLILSFILGLTIDMFSDSAGIHAAACTFIGYSRSYVLLLIKPRDDYDETKSPSVKDMGFAWFITYASILTVLHHFVYFYLEVFRLNEFFSIFLRIILSSIFTLFVTVIIQYFFSNNAPADK